jgi:hypothetical protein
MRMPKRTTCLLARPTRTSWIPTRALTLWILRDQTDWSTSAVHKSATGSLSRKNRPVFSAEKPSSDLAFKTTTQVSAQPYSPAPDGTVRLRQEYDRVASVFRSVGAYLPDGHTDSVFGWGVNASGALRIFGRDNIIAEGTYGHGVARYIQDNPRYVGSGPRRRCNLHRESPFESNTRCRNRSCLLALQCCQHYLEPVWLFECGGRVSLRLGGVEKWDHRQRSPYTVQQLRKNRPRQTITTGPSPVVDEGLIDEISSDHFWLKSQRHNHSFRAVRCFQRWENLGKLMLTVRRAKG